MLAATGAAEFSSETSAFEDLQARLTQMFQGFSDPDAPRTVLIVPSLSMDREVLANISGVHHYEERMLCYLMLLRLPRTQVIYVTSYPRSEEHTSELQSRQYLVCRLLLEKKNKNTLL